MTKREMTGWQRRTADKLTEKYPTDERTAIINEKGLAACGGAALLYVLVRLVYCGFQGRFAVPEFILLLVMAVMYISIQHQNGVCNLPKILGKELDPAVMPCPKRMGLYALDALIYAGGYTLIDYLMGFTSWHNQIGGLVSDFAIGFTVWFLLTMLMKEHSIKRYEKMKAQLEAEENDLS